MKKLSRLKLHNSQEVLNDSEMKMIRGGYSGYENYSHISAESSCNGINGKCNGQCSTVESYDPLKNTMRFYERTCVTGSFRGDGYVLNCLCAHVGYK